MSFINTILGMFSRRKDADGDDHEGIVFSGRTVEVSGKQKSGKQNDGDSRAGFSIAESEAIESETYTEKAALQSENANLRARLREKGRHVAGLLAAIVMQFCVIGTLLYAVLFHFPVTKFLWTSDARAVCSAMPLDAPDVSAARVTDFAANAAIDLHSYDYLNWHRMLTRALEMYLTPRERMQYERDLQTSGMIKTIQSGMITLTSVISGRPYIEQEGVRAADHRYFWIVQVPIELWYYNGTDSKPENRVLTMTVVRVDPSPINTNGIAIDDIVSVQATAKAGPHVVE